MAQFYQRPSKILDGSRVLLTARDPMHAEENFRLIEKNRDHLRPWMPWEKHQLSSEDSVKFFSSCVEAWQNRTMFDFSVFIKDDIGMGPMIGGAGLHSIDWSTGSAAFGFWIDLDHQGKGLISEAVQVLEEAARQVGIFRLEIRCHPQNTRSRKVAEANGYLKAGLIRDATPHGDRIDPSLIYEKLLWSSKNLPKGYEIKEFNGEDFWKQIDPLQKAIFSNESIVLPQNLISDPEKQALASLREAFPSPYWLHLILFYQGQSVGWSVGYQDSRESFYMMNSALLPEHRGLGLYGALIDQVLHRTKEKGFQRVWSRHTTTNNSVIIQKLRKGFVISGSELSDVFGSLVHLTYFFNPLRRELMDYRSGQIRVPKSEILKGKIFN